VSGATNIMKRRNIDIILEDAQGVLFNIPDFNFLAGKTVLVTGATGLLGTHILAVLALLNQAGFRIKVIGQCHSLPAVHTEEIAMRGGISLVMGDTDENADVILHLAGYAQPSVFTANPMETLKLNTTLTQELIESLRPGGKFLFTSSSEVYSGLNGIADEGCVGTTTPSHPRACYTYGKLCGETIVNACRQEGVDAKSVRLGLTYGPGTRKHDQRAMSTFVEQALTTGKIELKYSGLETRTFCYVSDAVELMFQVLLHGKHAVYNVGGGTKTNMRRIALEIAGITDVPLDVPMNSGEIEGAQAVEMNTSRVQNEFGKMAFTGLREGLKRTIEWQRGFYELI
jgi:UDP-glucuronate decarboxylase